MRVLFVDDEELVLEGIADMLHRDRHRWQVGFATGGRAALEILAAGGIDMVVTDLRMPDMDGEQLLLEVRERYPEVARIVLSGQAEAATAQRLLAVAHQFLAKPCPAEQVREVLARTECLKLLLADEELRALVGRMGALPVLPATYARLVRMLDDPRASIGSVAAAVREEPALSAKVMQAVNSAFFGLPNRMSDPQQAARYLGDRALRALILSLEVIDALSAGRGVLGAVAEQVRARGLATAHLAAVVARRIAPGAGDDAFLGGMLHDIGRLLLAARLPDEFRCVVATARDGGREEPAEREVLGVTHAEVGAYLIGLWGLPHPVVEAVAFHHDPARARHSTPCALTAVHVAAALAEPGRRELAPELDAGYLDALGLPGSPEAWAAVLPPPAPPPPHVGPSPRAAPARPPATATPRSPSGAGAARCSRARRGG